MITTLPRLGAVLVALGFAMPLRAQCPDGTPPPCRRAVARAAAPALSVAILDFRNLSRDSADAYLADGVAEEVASRLGRIQRLTVVSRTAVQRLPNAATMRTADVGRALNVAYLITGSVRGGGNRVRVGVELLNATTGVQGWSEQFDRDRGDLLSMQDEIASQVASAIAGRLLPAEQRLLAARPTQNAAAYEAYLKGLAANRRVSVNWAEALPWFRQAAAIDSAYADAWAMVSMSNSLLFAIGGPPDTLIQRAREAAARAIALAPESPLGHTAMGFVHYRGTYDYSRAQREFEIALRADPNSKDAHNGLATIFKRQGRFAESSASRLRSIALDPLDPAQPAEMSILLMSHRRFDDVPVWLDRWAALAPADSVTIRYYRLEALLGLGRLDEAVALAVRHPSRPRDLHRPIALRLLDTVSIRRHALARDTNEWALSHFVGWEELARLGGLTELARTLADSARDFIDRHAMLDSMPVAHTVEDHFNRARLLGVAGRTEAMQLELLRADSAARTLQDVLRVGNYYSVSADLLMNLGMKEMVLERLPRMLAAPGATLGGVSRARLRIDPLYAPLRGDPRFERIMAERDN